MLAAHAVPDTVASHWMLIAGSVAAAAAFFTRGWACRAALAAAVVALSAGWFRARCDEAPRGDLSRFLTADAALVRVEGRVASAPELRAGVRGEFARFEAHASGAWHFDLAAHALIDGAGNRTPVTGTLRVHARDEPAGLRPGDRAVLRGFVRAPRPAMNPGEPDRLRLARQSRVAGSIDIPAADFITTPTAPNTASDRIARVWARFTHRAQSLALGSLEPPVTADGPRAESESTALLRAMLLGQRDDDLRDLQGAFTRVGLAHVLSVSGMNLTLLAALALFALRLAGDHPRLEKLGIGVLVAGYLIVVPAEAPIIRAAIMIGVFTVAEWGGRRYDRLNTLAWSAVLSLLWRPMDLWSPGFQLSYLGVAALIALAHPLRVRLFGERPDDDTIGAGLRGFVLRRVEDLKTLFAASLCAWLITSPLVLWHTGVVSPIGPLANLVVWPVVGAITGAGYFLVLVGTIIPLAAPWGTPALHSLGDLLAWLVRSLDALPAGVWYAPPISLAWCAAATTLAAWWMLSRHKSAFAPRAKQQRIPRVSPRIAQALAASTLLTWFGLEWWLRPALPSRTLELTTLHIPGGACTALRSGRDTLLYGGGSPWGSAGQRLIPAARRTAHISRGHAVIIPAADPDQYNAIPDLVRPLGIREALVSEQFMRQAQDVPEGPGAYLLARLADLGVEVRTVAAGDSITVGDAVARILAPPRGTLMKTHRDASIVVEFGAAADSPAHAPAVILGEIAREGFDALRSTSHSSNAGVVLMPRAGWVASHPEQVTRWCAPAGKPPTLIIRASETDRGTPTTHQFDTLQDGCVRMRKDPSGEWNVVHLGR